MPESRESWWDLLTIRRDYIDSSTMEMVWFAGIYFDGPFWKFLHKFPFLFSFFANFIKMSKVFFYYLRSFDLLCLKWWFPYKISHKSRIILHFSCGIRCFDRFAFCFFLFVFSRFPLPLNSLAIVGVFVWNVLEMATKTHIKPQIEYIKEVLFVRCSLSILPCGCRFHFYFFIRFILFLMTLHTHTHTHEYTNTQQIRGYF